MNLELKERSLVFFTLLMQASVGSCLVLFIIELGNFSVLQTMPQFFKIGWLTGFLLAVIGLASSFFHLHLPLHAWRGIINLRTSWLSREILSASIYTCSMFIILFLQFFYPSISLVSPVKWIALTSGLAMIFCMGSAYRLNTVKFWYSSQTIVTFYTSAFILGLLICGVLCIAFGSDDYNIPFLLIHYSWLLSILIFLKLIISYNGFIRLTSEKDMPIEKIKKLMLIQFSFGILAIILTLLLFFVDQSLTSWLIWPVVVFTFLSELFGRFLFYEAQLPYGVYLLKL